MKCTWQYVAINLHSETSLRLYRLLRAPTNTRISCIQYKRPWTANIDGNAYIGIVIHTVVSRLRLSQYVELKKSVVGQFTSYEQMCNMEFILSSLISDTLC